MPRNREYDTTLQTLMRYTDVTDLSKKRQTPPSVEHEALTLYGRDGTRTAMLGEKVGHHLHAVRLAVDRECVLHMALHAVVPVHETVPVRVR